MKQVISILTLSLSFRGEGDSPIRLRVRSTLLYGRRSLTVDVRRKKWRGQMLPPGGRQWVQASKRKSSYIQPTRSLFRQSIPQTVSLLSLLSSLNSTFSSPSRYQPPIWWSSSSNSCLAMTVATRISTARSSRDSHEIFSPWSSWYFIRAESSYYWYSITRGSTITWIIWRKARDITWSMRKLLRRFRMQSLEYRDTLMCCNSWRDIWSNRPELPSKTI